MAPGRFRFRWLLGAAGLLAVGSVLWFLREERSAESPEPARATSGAPRPETAARADSSAAPSVAAVPAPPPITVMPAARELSAALLRRDDPAGALEAVEQLLYFYRQGLGENPVGQNEDIVAAMLGENPKRAAYLAAESPAIKDGRLLDPWGTPYWFHPVSRDHMEIRSAGPDRELFTGDDLRRE
jgi:Type II secretion system (T2SS), protein G